MTQMTNVLARASYHAVYDASILDALRFAGENGFSGIQVAVESPHLGCDDLSVDECGRIATFREARGLRICLHAPDAVASLYATNRHLREGTFAYFAALLEFAERIGSRLINIHPGMVSTFGTDSQPQWKIPPQDLPLYRRVFQDNLSRLIDLVAGRCILCVENYQMDATVREVIQPHLDAKRLFLCWDLAKSYRADGAPDEAQEAFFWANLPHIAQVHLHDRANGRSQHLAVGEGQLDFLHYLPRLSQANVVDFCHEVRPRDRAVQSLANLRKIIEGQANNLSRPASGC
jgi:sugar phosphate isomerase/epimerase